MDFSEFSSYPMVANPDFSPTNDAFLYPDAFDKAYSIRPDCSFDTFSDTDSFFERPLNSVETPTTGFAPKNQSLFNTTVPTPAPATAPMNLSSWSTINPAPFGRISNINEGFNTSPSFNNITSDSFDTTAISPQNSSPTPSLCGDGPRPQVLSSPSLSPRSLKRESPEEPDLISEPNPKRPQKKRGRPRLDRTSNGSASSIISNSCKSQRTTQRLPHNQVERKYREGLNSELERLRRAVPTLIQCDPLDLAGPPKPSKATILASAIEYIKKIEMERDAALEEVERLRMARPNVTRHR